MAKLASLTKAYGDIKDTIEASSKDGASSPASTTNKIQTSTYSVSGSSGSYGDFDPSLSVENSSQYQGVGEGITQKGTTTNDGSDLTGAQAGTALVVGGLAAVLNKSGALSSPDGQETIKAAGQAVLENAGLSSATASSVLAAAAGDKNAKLDVGLKAANVLSGGLITEKLGNTVTGALQGDKNAQRALVLDAVNVLSNKDSPTAPAVTVVKDAVKSTVDEVFPVGSPLRNLASELGGLFGGNKASNNAPGDAPPVITNSSGISRLQKARQRKDPLLSFDWMATVPDIGCPNITVDQSLFVSFYIEEANVTLPYFQNTDVFRCGTRKNYPGFSDTGTLSLVFYEDREMNATTYIEYWKSKIQNRETGRYKVPKKYKQDIEIVCYDARGIIAGKFVAKGCWPAQSGNFQLQSSASDRITRSADFNTDGVFFTRYINGSPINNAVDKSQAVNQSGPLVKMLQAAGNFAKSAVS